MDHPVVHRPKNQPALTRPPVLERTTEPTIYTPVEAPTPAPEPAPEPPKSAKSKNPFRGKDKRLVFGGSALVIVIVGFLGWSWIGKGDVPLPTNMTNEIPKLGAATTLIDGTAKVVKQNGEVVELTTDTVLSEGDKITTDAASRTIITFDDGSVIRVDELSTVSLASLEPENVKIDNEKGEVYARVIKSDRTFTVVVDEVEYTALGTAFKTVNSETNDGVQVLESSVAVEGQEAKVDEGKQFYELHQDVNLQDKITDVSVDELKSDGFMLWNLEQDKQSAEFKDKLGYWKKVEEQPAPAAPTTEAPGASIKLSATTYDKGVRLKWTVTNVSGNEGYKVVRSKKSTTPTYGKDESSFVGGAAARGYDLKDGSGITYNYRVCAYKDGVCSTYSNVVTIQSPYVAPEAVVSGPVSLSLGGMSASWTFGGTAPHGFKLLVDDEHNPTYGNSNKQVFADKSPVDVSNLGLTAGTYYMRVCKYTADGNVSGGCTDYSNEVELIIP